MSEVTRISQTEAQALIEKEDQLDRERRARKLKAKRDVLARFKEQEARNRRGHAEHFRQQAGAAEKAWEDAGYPAKLRGKLRPHVHRLFDVIPIGNTGAIVFPSSADRYQQLYEQSIRLGLLAQHGPRGITAQKLPDRAPVILAVDPSPDELANLTI